MRASGSDFGGWEGLTTISVLIILIDLVKFSISFWAKLLSFYNFLYISSFSLSFQIYKHVTICNSFKLLLIPVKSMSFSFLTLYFIVLHPFSCVLIHFMRRLSRVHCVLDTAFGSVALPHSSFPLLVHCFDLRRFPLGSS